MGDYRLTFDTLPWTNAAAGLQYKEYKKEAIKLRLVEFSDGFIEHDWCSKGHLGIVLDGRAKVVFNNGREVEFVKGDIIHIPPGELDKHKTVISQGQSIQVLFIDDNA